MADLILDVDFSKVSRAIDELSRLGKLSKDTNRGMAQATRLVVQWQEKFAAQQGRVNAEIEKNVLKTKLANKSARESASVFEEVERQIKANTIALNNMRASYDKNFAVEQKTLALKKILRQEVANGNMTVREAGAELLKYRQNLTAYNQVQIATTKTQNRFGVVTQQAGYQIGDFLVQVQSGTNWMVAFGQQATQLVGILPLLAPAGGTFLGLGAGPLLALSAGLGIAIPLVTAIGAAFTRTSKEAEKPIDKVQKFTDALSRFKDLSESSRKSVNDLAEEFGSMATEIKDLDKYLKSVAVSRALDAFSTGSFLSLQEPLKDIEEFYNKAESLRSAFTDDATAANKSLQDGITAALRRSESLASDFGLSAESAVKFKNALDAIGKSESLVSIRDNAKAALDVIRQMYPEGAKLPLELANAVEELDKILRAASRATAEMDGTANGARTLNSELSKALSNANAFADAMARARRESASIGLSTEGVKAQIKVLQGGGSKAEAAAQAAAVTLRGELTSELSGAPSRGAGARIENLVAKRYQEVLANEQARESLGDLLGGAGKSGGGGKSSILGQLEQVENFLKTERELLVSQYEERQTTLEMALQKGYLTKSKYVELELELERKKASELAKIDAATQQAKVSAVLGGISQVLTAAANGNEKTLRMARIAGAAEALINTYIGASEALKLPFPANLAAAASILSTGFGFVNAIKSGNKSAGASGAAATMPAATQAAAPQRVIVEGLDRNSLYSGQQLSNIFEALYKENKDRGFVFEVKR